MKFDTPLLEARFLKRYKRFFADVELDGEIVTAHCPNTGSMKGCLFPEAPCRVTFVDDPKRKLKYTLQMVKAPKTWIGVNTGLPNNIVFEAFEKQVIPHWQQFPHGKKEVKINDKTRLDMAFWQPQEVLTDLKKWDSALIEKYKFHFVEVKNVTLVENQVALFPDSVSTRGQKHIEELCTLMDQGHTCEIVFTLQRNDAKSFSGAKNIDPTYAELLKQASKKGLRITPIVCQLSKTEIKADPKQILPYHP